MKIRKPKDANNYELTSIPYYGNTLWTVFITPQAVKNLAEMKRAYTWFGKVIKYLEAKGLE